MKYATLPYPIFNHSTHAKLNLYPYISSYFKKFCPSPLLKKQTFVVQTVTFQTKLPNQSHTVWL